MNNFIHLALLFLSVVMSWQSLAAEPIEIKSAFKVYDVKWVKEKGGASVVGSASIKLENGELKGCAGFNVELLPVADYSSERILKTYGNNKRGQILVSENPPKFTPDVKEYHEMVIFSKCNADNEFVFNDVPAGNFYVLAFIIWDETKAHVSVKSGGAVMKKIKVKSNSKVEVRL